MQIFWQEIFFAKGENQKYIMLEILDDEIAEPDEMFQVILSQPRDGVEIGDPFKGTPSSPSQCGNSHETIVNCHSSV
jgi:hypothetical protein